jgi:hypothetical protein
VCQVLGCCVKESSGDHRYSRSWMQSKYAVFHIEIWRNSEFWQILTPFGAINCQSLNGILMHRSPGYIVAIKTKSQHDVCRWQRSFSNLILTVQSVTEYHIIMPTTVSFPLKKKKEKTFTQHIVLYHLTLITFSDTSFILVHLDLCAVQTWCTVCSTYIARDRWDAHRSAHWREGASQPSTSTFNISIDATSFDSFFNHESSPGARLTVIQRATIVALHSLNLRSDLIARLTHCDLRTIQHWINYFNEHHSLQDEPRSGRPMVTAPTTDTAIVATATETPITTPRIIRSELGVQASARTESRQLDSAALCGAVRRNENQRTVPRFQFSHEHQN